MTLPKGYYSYDLGAWHVIVLNSNCAFAGGCQAGSVQEQWLRADLAANPAGCTVAMWHHPRISGGTSDVQALWQALYDAGAELVLTGHEHSYQRFKMLSGAGTADAAFGLREFVVGTGGVSHYALGAPSATTEAQNDNTFGVLKLTLHASSYDWRFIPEAGKTFTDSGMGTCHGAPTAPFGFIAP